MTSPNPVFIVSGDHGRFDQRLMFARPEAVYPRHWEHDDPIDHVPAHCGRDEDVDYHAEGLGAPGAPDRIVERECGLYDLEHDPEELTNVVDDPADADALQQPHAQLARLQGDVDDHRYEGPGSTRPDWNPESLQHHSGAEGR